MREIFPKFIRKILITGGCGFIGSAVCRRILSESSVKIFNLDKISNVSDTTSIDRLLINLDSLAKERYFLLPIDISNFEKTKEAVKQADPDLVIHLAAESHVDRSIDSPSEFINSNIIGTFNLLESVRFHWNQLNINRKKNFKFHHISTDEVFGSLGDKGKFNEDTPYDPRSPYSASKASSDHLVKAWHHTYGLPTVLSNCSNNFGPWQFPEKLIPLAILKALSGQEIPLYGNGLNIRDWLYVEDHVDAILTIVVKGEIGESYCVGGNSELTNKEVLDYLCRELDIKKPANIKYSNLIKFVQDRPGHDQRYAINADKIKRELGWNPKHNFKDALSKTIDWYLKNLDWCDYVMKKSSYKTERLGLKN